MIHLDIVFKIFFLCLGYIWAWMCGYKPHENYKFSSYLTVFDCNLFKYFFLLLCLFFRATSTHILDCFEFVPHLTDSNFIGFSCLSRIHISPSGTFWIVLIAVFLSSLIFFFVMSNLLLLSSSQFFCLIITFFISRSLIWILSYIWNAWIPIVLIVLLIMAVSFYFFMSVNFLIDARHYEFYLTKCWIFLYPSKSFWGLFWDIFKLLRRNLILLCIAFKKY